MYTLCRHCTGLSLNVSVAIINAHLHFAKASHRVQSGNRFYYAENAYLHFVPTPHWAKFVHWDLSQKAVAYTLHWRRTGTNFDTESLNRKRVHTLCADIALGQILISKPPPNKKNTYTLCWRRTGPNLLIEMLTKRRLRCAGIAMDRILILKLRRKMPTYPTYLLRAGSILTLELHAKHTYLHFVLESLWVRVRYWSLCR